MIGTFLGLGDARVQIVAKDRNGVMATCSFAADLTWHPVRIADVDNVGCEYQPAQLSEIMIADRSGAVLHWSTTAVADLLAENKRLRERLARLQHLEAGAAA